MRAGFTEGVIIVTCDLVDDPERCEWHFLTISGRFGRWSRDWDSCIFMSRVAYNSRDISQVHDSRVVGSLHGNTFSPLRAISSNEPVSYPSMSPVPFIFLFEKKLFLALIEERCWSLLGNGKWLELVTLGDSSFPLLDSFLSFSTSVPSFLGVSC